VIGPNKSIVPQGSFAEAQAQYLDPDPDAVEALSQSLIDANMGIVAHYYMDVELQGVLTAVKRRNNGLLSNRIGIADSLKMGDLAVSMCQDDGVTAVACLGVDFMSESVSAIMGRNGFGHVPVYRATPAAIGCSLAESAERDSYRAWLTTAKENEDALHIVYINTSLETKAVSTSIAPTITCTSSNVLKTMLQASAQVGPSLKILYGPDTYMGENLVALFDAILLQGWDDARIARDLHPLHNRDTLKTLRDNVNVYPSGNCVVHHMFGSEVVDAVKRNYKDAYVTAHLEVPGEMFQVAMEKSMQDKGVVGSTSDILNFITKKVNEAAQEGGETRLQFVLGTEAGMVTSIVKSVQDILDATGSNVEAEIIFPVASDAVMGVEDDSNMSLVPGVSGGEGCSTAGGCATCPFMKMNDLDALQDVIEMVSRTRNGGSSKDEMTLTTHLPPQRLQGRQIGGVDAMDLGTQPILYMREFMKNGALPDELLNKVRRVSS
jgi:quinolinate synthase